ncbi:MAG: sulfatase-like hydrolase/transferase, partial [Nitrospinales bacterium]
FYDFAEYLAGGFSITGGKNKYFVPAWGVLFFSSVYAIARTRKALTDLGKFLNLLGFFLILFPMINIGLYEVQSKETGGKTAPSSQKEFENSPGSAEAAEMPNIYYIILDAYANEEVLKKVFNFDNSGFIDFLKKKGFYVAAKSPSNYAMTYLSLPATLNMEYMNYLSDKVGEDSDDRNEPYKLLENNRTVRFLKSKGYRYVHFSSGWNITESNPNADLEIDCGRGNEFLWVVIEKTLYYPFEQYLNFVGGDARKRILCTFSRLPEMSELKRPNFIFAHMAIPHGPYLFGPNGEPNPKGKFDATQNYDKDPQGYLGQLIFCSKKVKELVEKILASEKDVPPIIIIQSDHGPATSGKFTNPPADTLLNERMKVLNAFYLPGKEGVLYDSISPVNTFRVVFNAYFGADYELLKDESYYSTYERPYKFMNVTDRIKFN